jgi:hypothetical protein
MQFGNWFISLLLGLGVILLMFIMISIFDIVLSVLYTRFYSTASFVATFGVGGVFACIFSFSQAVEYAAVKDEFTRRSVTIMILVTAALFIYPLSVLEGGEYQAAFISYGITLALTSILYIKRIL